MLPLIVLAYILADWYVHGERKMAIDLMSYINALIFVVGLVLLNKLIKEESNLRYNSIFWLNNVIVFSAALGVVSSLLLNRLFEYQRNEWFSLIYFGFWSFIGLFNMALIVYAIYVDGRKLPSLDKMPSFTE